MLKDSLPRGRLLLWILLVPIASAPSFLLGERPDAVSIVVTAFAVALAFAVLPLSRTDALERLSSVLEPLAGRILFAVAVVYFTLSVLHARSQLAGFADYNQLGLFGQSFWTLQHGHPFSNTCETVDGTLGSHHGVHFSPTLLLLAPLYAVWPNPLVLIAGQALALCVLPVPVFHLLRPRIGAAASLVLALAILAVPNFLWAGGRDFRDANFLPVLLCSTVWAIDRGRWGWFVPFALLALGVREEIGVVFVMVALFALLSGRGVRAAIGIAALGLAWFAIAVGVVMPRFVSPGLWMDAKRFFGFVLGQWGPTPLSAALNIVTHPLAVLRSLADGMSVRYVYGLVRPLLFAPPLFDWAAIVAVPGLALNLLSRLPFMRGPDQAYSLVPMTFLCLATVRTAARFALRAAEPRRVTAAMAFAIVVLAGVLPSLPSTARRAPLPVPPIEATRALILAIPSEAPVYAPMTLYSAMCNREYFGSWYTVLERGREPELRGRYAYVVLWPKGEAVWEREAPLLDSLLADPRFVRREGFEPFVVFERR